MPVVDALEGILQLARESKKNLKSNFCALFSYQMYFLKTSCLWVDTPRSWVDTQRNQIYQYISWCEVSK